MTMIFDRTAETVKAALKIREEKVKNNIELTEDEIDTLERGFLTISTLNRIESNQHQLKIMFNSAGYWNTPLLNKNWRYSSMFFDSDLQRILQISTELKNAFLPYSNTPRTPSTLYDYNGVNDAEKILSDLESAYADMSGKYRQCGTFECGEENTN